MYGVLDVVLVPLLADAAVDVGPDTADTVVPVVPVVPVVVGQVFAVDFDAIVLVADLDPNDGDGVKEAG